MKLECMKITEININNLINFWKIRFHKHNTVFNVFLGESLLISFRWAVHYSVTASG